MQYFSDKINKGGYKMQLAAVRYSSMSGKPNVLIAFFCAIMLLLGSWGASAAPTVDGVFTPSDGYTNVQSLTFQLQNGTLVPNPGTLAWTTDAAGNVYAAFVQPLSINDNTYGTNALGWGKQAHGFNNLVGSDKAEFDFTNGAGQKFIYTLDYIGTSKTAPSGFASLGVTGGDGSVGKSSVKGVTGGGHTSDVLQWGTSLAFDLNSINKTFTTNSPATTPVALNPNGTIDYSKGYNNPASAPGWVYNIEYEVEIAASAFGPSGFAGVTVPFAHDSPSKFGQNQIIVVPEPRTYILVLIGIALTILFRRDRVSRAIRKITA
jgi:hypothetical protein